MMNNDNNYLDIQPLSTSTNITYITFIFIIQVFWAVSISAIGFKDSSEYNSVLEGIKKI